MGLVGATATFAVTSPLVLLAVPFGFLVFFMPERRLLAVVLAVTGAFLVAGGEPSSGLWYFERGWAILLGGCFLALTLRWPAGGFISRGLGAVLGAFLFMGLLLGVRPGEWAVVDWVLRSRMEDAVAAFIQAARVSLGPEVVTAAMEASALEVIAFQGFVFPALHGLASLSALGAAWWLFKRLTGDGLGGIGRLRDFRFNDQFIWVFILGIVALLVSSGAVARAGVNAVFFMGALYALRGAAVVLFFTGGMSFFGAALLALGFLIVAPFVVMGAIVIGLGDTWFDLRTGRASPRSEA